MSKYSYVKKLLTDIRYHFQSSLWNQDILTLFRLTSGLPKIDWEGESQCVPSISILWHNLLHLIHFLRALGLYFSNLRKKMLIFKNPNSYCKFSYLEKTLQKTKFREIWQILHSYNSPWPSKLKSAIIFATFSRKTENVQIPFKGASAKIYATFICRNFVICLLLFRIKKNILIKTSHLPFAPLEHHLKGL